MAQLNFIEQGLRVLNIERQALAECVSAHV